MKTRSTLFKIVFWPFVGFLFLFKLSYAYFFTDEILYTMSGLEYMHGNYTRNLQHPLLGKYLVGLVTLFTRADVFWLRLPYALLGVVSAWLIFCIIKKQYGAIWGYVASLLYVFSPFIYETTRMVMLESPMYLWWLGFHLFFLDYLYEKRAKSLWLAGVFLGLGMATKFSTIILYPFSLVIFIFSFRRKLSMKNVISFLKMYILSGVIYGGSYIFLFIQRGFLGLKDAAKETLSVFLGRNVEGKFHVVNNKVYERSPWWFYLYYLKENYNSVHLGLTFLSPLGAFVDKSFFAIYWLVLFIFSVVFFQFIPLKNSRYIASFEIPLIILLVICIRWVYTKFLASRKSLVLLGILFISTSVFGPRLAFVLLQKPTKYNALIRYFDNKTEGFTTKDRIYIYGSVRSSRWYTEDIPPQVIVFRRDFDVMCADFHTFTYFVFDMDDLPRDWNNALYTYVKESDALFEKEEKFGFWIYSLKHPPLPQICISP